MTFDIELGYITYTVLVKKKSGFKHLKTQSRECYCFSCFVKKRTKKTKLDFQVVYK